MTLRRLAPALAAPALAVLILAGCTAAPTSAERDSANSPAPSASAASDQTKAEACAGLMAGFEVLIDLDANQLMDDMENDPEAAIATLDEAEEVILAATDRVSNEELQPVVEEAEAATTEYFALVRDAAENPANADAAAIQEGIGAFTESIVGLQTACAGA